MRAKGPTTLSVMQEQTPRRGENPRRAVVAEHAVVMERAAALPARRQPEHLNPPPALLPVHAGACPRAPTSRAPRAPLDLPARRHKATRPRERHAHAASGGLSLRRSAAPPPLLCVAAYHGAPRAQPCSQLHKPCSESCSHPALTAAGPAEELGARHGLADACGQALPRDACPLQADAPPDAPYQPDPTNRAIYRPCAAGAGGRKHAPRSKTKPSMAWVPARPKRRIGRGWPKLRAA